MKYLSLFLSLLLIGCAASDAPDETTSPVPDNPLNVNPLIIGNTIPDLSLQNLEDETVGLREIASRQPTVWIFYRGGWCPFCNSHLADLVQLEDDLYDLGYQIVAISPDQPDYLRQTLDDHEPDYTLMSDSSMDVTRAFGLAFQVDDETVQRYKENGMDLAGRSGHDHHQLPVPAVYITDTSGEILFQYVNPNYRTRISGEVLIAAAKAEMPDVRR